MCFEHHKIVSVIHAFIKQIPSSGIISYTTAREYGLD